LLQTVEPNKTLLVDGPASVMLAAGRAEVFGCQVKQAQRIVVREGKRLPFYVAEKATFDLSLGPNAGLNEVSGTTIPSSWGAPLESIQNTQKKPVVILVFGKGDSGKSSYCTYLVNSLVDGKCRVAVLDGDLGQSDIGSSGTVGYALISKQVPELYDLKLENAFFVGVTSPMTAMAKTIEAAAAMRAEILQRATDFVVINADGWIEGDIAVHYKAALIKKLSPDVIVGVQAAGELDELIANIDQKVLKVEASSSLSPRTAEKRKALREMTYVRYLKDSKLQSYPINQLTIEPHDALPKEQKPEQGLLVGFYGSGTKFLGIGVLREINHARRTLKVQTAVAAKPTRIVLGQVRLDEKLREIQD